MKFNTFFKSNRCRVRIVFFINWICIGKGDNSTLFECFYYTCILILKKFDYILFCLIPQS